MNIYENLFSFTTSCDIIIADAVGFTQRVPLVGDEHLIITYRSTTSDIIITRSFKIYKVGERLEGAQRQENYIIHGISEYAIFNEMRSIDRSFRGKKTSEAIEDAFANGLGQLVVLTDIYPWIEKFTGLGKDGVKDQNHQRVLFFRFNIF